MDGERPDGQNMFLGLVVVMVGSLGLRCDQQPQQIGGQISCHMLIQ